MPRVHHVKKARKAQPPTRQQLTQSSYYIAVYDIEDMVAALTADTMDGLECEVQNVIDAIESLRDETQEKLDNMPEQLQYGDTGQLLQEGRKIVSRFNSGRIPVGLQQALEKHEK
jgi:hypothetical protein